MKHAGAAALKAARDPAPPVACLVSGPDHGLVRRLCDQLQASLLKSMPALSVQRMDEADLKADPSALAGSLGGPSLFGDVSLVRLRLAGETLSEIVLEALAGLAPGKGGPALIVQAGEMAKASRLRKGFEAHPWAWSLQTYDASREDLANAARDAAKAVGASIATDGLAALLEGVAQDVDTVASESTKLGLFVGPGGEIGPAAISAVGSGSREAVIDDSIHAAFSGDGSLAISRLQQALGSGAHPVQGVNALLRRVRLLMQLRLAFDGGERASELVRERHYGIFFKRQDEMAAQVTRWSQPLLASVLASAVELDARTKTGGAPAETDLADFLMRLARRARSA
jgi:DNA polymerase III subunit delta